MSSIDTSNERHYTKQQVDRILTAYKGLFPKITLALAKYCGLSRKRQWPLLTSDFHVP